MRATSRWIRIVVNTLYVVLSAASGAAAQSPVAPASHPSPFLRDTAFYFQWGSFITSDPRFSWDAAMGLDLELFEYRGTRINFAADYEGVLGSELRPFELNHENFSLDG